jgi:hypothetical protein
MWLRFVSASSSFSCASLNWKCEKRTINIQTQTWRNRDHSVGTIRLVWRGQHTPCPNNKNFCTRQTQRNSCWQERQSFSVYTKRLHVYWFRHFRSVYQRLRRQKSEDVHSLAQNRQPTRSGWKNVRHMVRVCIWAWWHCWSRGLWTRR